MRCKAVHHKSDAALCATVHQREDIFLPPLPISHPDDKLLQSSRACHSRNDTWYTILGASLRAKSWKQRSCFVRHWNAIAISRSPDMLFSFAFSAHVARSKFLRFWQKKIKTLCPLDRGEARRKCAFARCYSIGVRRIPSYRFHPRMIIPEINSFVTVDVDVTDAREK